MIPMIHWSKSPQKMVKQIYNYREKHVWVTLKYKTTLHVKVLGSSYDPFYTWFD
jgi:hypothetical protein